MNRHLYSGLMLIVAAFLLFTAYNAYIPVTDPMESNYALTAKEMLLVGDWLSPRIYGQYWFDKPVLTYWLIALSYKLFGINEFAARLPSAVFSMLSLGLLYWFVNKLYCSRRAAFFSAIILASSLEFWFLGRMIITDAILFFFNSMALAFFYLALLTARTRWIILAYIGCGMAVLTKGPVGIVLPGIIMLTYTVLKRRIGIIAKLFSWQGLFVFLLLALPWNIFMYKAHGRVFVDTFWGLHNYLRATVSEHPQDNVWYYYLVLFPFSLLPWTGVFLKALIAGLRESKNSSHFAYLAIWLGTTIAFYTMMATKYPTYVFPAMFPAAVIAGKYLERLADYRERTWYWLTVPVFFYFLAAAVCVNQFVAGDWRLLYLTVAVFTAGLFFLYYRQLYRYLPSLIAAAALIMSIILIGNGLAKYAAGRSMPEISSYNITIPAIIGYYHDYSTSAVFYSGNNILRIVDKASDMNSEGVWSGKYTMPTVTIEQFLELANQNETYVLVNKANEAEFSSKFALRKLELVFANGKRNVYKLSY